MDEKSYINASQIRAARALLDWSQDDLAQASDLSVATIRKIESGHISPRDSTMGAIKESLEVAKIEFLPLSGLRLKDNDLTTIEGPDAYLQLLEDIRRTMTQKKGEVLFLYADSSAATESEIATTLHMRGLGIKWRFISEEGNTHMHYPLDEYRWMPKSYFKRNLQVIYDNKVAMGHELDRKTNTTIRITLIESPRLAESNRNLFNFMWDNCRKPSHSTASKIYI